MELRKINPIEVNKSVTSLPDGVFGYSYAYSLEHYASLLNNPENDLSRLIIEKRNRDEDYKRYLFEIRKYSQTDIRLIGYISDEAQLAYTQKGGFYETEILVFPFVYNEFKNFLEIQLYNHSLKIENRKVEFDDIAISILEISKFILTSVKQDIKSDKDKKQTKSPINIIDFVKKVLPHPIFLKLIIALFIFLFFIITGINLKDYLV